jgi:hypothetical protein
MTKGVANLRGPSNGYGPGQGINKDHIMSGICHVGVFEHVHIPTIPVHLLI